MRYFIIGYQAVNPQGNNVTFGDLNVESVDNKFPSRKTLDQEILKRCPGCFRCTLTYIFEFKDKADWESFNET